MSSLPDADIEGGLDPGAPGRGRERSVESSLEVLPYGHKTGASSWHMDSWQAEVKVGLKKCEIMQHVASQRVAGMQGTHLDHHC